MRAVCRIASTIFFFWRKFSAALFAPAKLCLVSCLVGLPTVCTFIVATIYIGLDISIKLVNENGAMALVY